MLPLIATLIQSGLGLVANAAIEKGASWVEEKTGIKLDQSQSPNSEQLNVLKQFQLENEPELMKIQLERDHINADLMRDLNAQAVANAGDVNKTMQAEAAAEHWPTYSWRPSIGFSFALLGLIGGVTAAISYIGVMFCGVKPEVLNYLPAMLGAEAAIMATMAPVLGIASWYRGKMQADPSIPTVNRG
jgi:hypothetical protein